MKIQLFLADGFEEIETVTTLDVLRRCGLAVEIVSIKGTRHIRGSHGISTMADATFRKHDTMKCDAIILPGGMPGASNLLAHDGLTKCLASLINTKTVIAAICAAPMILGRIGVLQRRLATCYPSFETELTGATVLREGVVEDKNLITARGPAYAMDFAFAIAARFVAQEVIEQVKRDMLLIA